MDVPPLRLLGLLDVSALHRVFLLTVRLSFGGWRPRIVATGSSIRYPQG